MKLEFTKKEVDYFKENCYFTDEEEKILDEAISKYSEEKGVLYGFVSEAVNYG